MSRWMSEPFETTAINFVGHESVITILNIRECPFLYIWSYLSGLLKELKRKNIWKRAGRDLLEASIRLVQNGLRTAEQITKYIGESREFSLHGILLSITN